jgi:hypothetical protein
MIEGGTDALLDELLPMLNSLMPDQQRRIELERLDAARLAVETIARKLEGWGTNELYAKAIRSAVKQIRGKWLCEVSEMVNDASRMSDVNTSHGAQEAPCVEPGSHARGFGH